MSVNVLLYTRRDREIDEYERLIRAAQMPMELLVCRTPAEAVANAGQAEVIFGVHLPPEIYAHASRVRWIQSMFAGVEWILRAPVPKNIIITKPVGVFGRFISQYVFAYMLAHRVNMRGGLAQQQAREWQPYQLTPICDERMGIAGVGDIGREIARIAKSFNMEVWGLNRDGRAQAHIDRMFAAHELKEFAAGVDTLVIILPNTAHTRGLFNREVLSAMKRRALLINVGRGAIIDDTALVAILKEGGIAGAVLDVFVEEPLPADHPYWQLPNCIVTPHVGGPSLPKDITKCFLENFRRYQQGQPLLGTIDREREY